MVPRHATPRHATPRHAGRFIPHTGKCDVVFVDHVARRVIEAIYIPDTYVMSTSGKYTCPARAPSLLGSLGRLGAGLFSSFPPCAPRGPRPSPLHSLPCRCNTA